ncbi:MAG TPA: dihydrodipicolinate reductase C-terminal domain-containing protein [Gaiellaceae bacterium]|nr:dihydrodipicolinate reductase C-terminal domain-containing protein [Gaiellaceae bacterium]
MRIILNGYSPPSPEMGKVGGILGPALAEAGHELVATEEDAEAMIDFTTPSAAVPNILRAVEAGVPSIVGTSGWDPEEVHGPARSAGVAVFYAPNFALGAVLMMRFAREASKYLPAAEIVELHHETKLDAPSGTALATAAAMEGKPAIHSVRLPGLVAHQEVILGGRGETLTIRHDTSSRDAFVPGVELALSKLGTLPPGVTVGLDALL